MKPIEGEVPWGPEAISNAVWSGTRLSALLEAAGVEPQGRHVECHGMDSVVRKGTDVGYASSIPIEKALADEVLVAWEMNGAPLPPEHGYPVRLVVPGFIGARSVKWLRSIVVLESESNHYFQQLAYKVFPASVTAETVNWRGASALLEFPVTSVICDVGLSTDGGRLHVRGYAVSGAGPIVSVQVSSDGESTWKEARIDPGDRDEAPWAWRLWTIDIPVPEGARGELSVTARDAAGQVQPSSPDALWNFKGYMNNARHRVALPK